MGTDAKLLCKRNNKTVYCDRLYNIDNDYTRDSWMLEYLKNEGLPAGILKSLIVELNKIRPDGMYDEILVGLSSFEDDDLFILIDEHDERY
jgi:hypothetical protein